MSSSKKALKAIKDHIENKDHQTALYEATELLKKLNDKDPEAAQALVFRGLALTHVGKKEEAEKCYIHAHKLQVDNKLAKLGLRKLYEKDESWDKLGRFLETLVQESYDEGDAEGCSQALQELLELRNAHGSGDDLYRTLSLVLPSSPLLPLLQSIPPPQGSFTPFSMPTYPSTSLTALPSLPKPLPHVLHLLSSLPLLLHMLIRVQGLVHQTVETKVKAARTRLGAGTEKEVRRNVETEVLGGELGNKLVELLREVGNHPGCDESVRRAVEVEEFHYWRKLVGCLGSDEVKKDKKKAKATSQDDFSALPLPPLFEVPTPIQPTKAEALARADGLANGFVLLGVAGNGAEEAWSWVLNGKDEPTLYYDLDFLHKYAKIFPDSPLTDFIDDYCRWFNLSPPDPEDDLPTLAAEAEGSGAWSKAKGKKRKGPNARERRKARRLAANQQDVAEDIDQEEKDELLGAMNKLLDQLPKSIFAYRVMARISGQEEDWANAISSVEKARSVLKEVESERGVSLPRVRTALDAALGVSLVHYFPPKHHSRASNLLNAVLKVQPVNSEARFARGQIFETAGNWSEAKKNFEMILNVTEPDQSEAQQIQDAADLVISKDAEEDKRLTRSIVGAKEEIGWCLVNEGKLEKGREVLEEVVELRDTRHEQGGKEDEALARARAWWRLGRAEWMIGDAESKQRAEEWFTASIRALSNFAPAFTSLGFSYLDHTPPDTERALKCFQKAFELDATEVEAAKRLALGYADEDDWAGVRVVASRVMEGEGGIEGVAGGSVVNPKGRLAPTNGWAWKALGSTEMHYHNYAKAAQAYQIALRADDKDISTWTQLGEAYLRSGRHMAALKTLNQALELDPDHWMAMYDIGDVYNQLGSYEEAIEAYEKVIQSHPSTTTDKAAEANQGDAKGRADQSLIGVMAKMAESTLTLGRTTAAGGFRERSRRAFHRTIRLVTDILDSRAQHRAWAWKMIGDATFELSSQDTSAEDSEESMNVLRPVLGLLVEDDNDKRATIPGLGHPAELLVTDQSSSTPAIPAQTGHDVLRVSAFAFAYRSYLLKNEPRVSFSAHYDLATSLHALGRRLEGEERMSCMKAAAGSVRLAMEKDAGDERLWNALGVICAEGGEEVAQHAFVVSLELYAKDPIVWTNLGFLYLRLDELELANQCLLKAQTIDPDCAKAWLGQGLLAEKQGDLEHAKALFAHSVTLSAGSLLEADLALAASIFQPFLSSSALDTALLRSPAFALRHYIHQRPRDSAAAHLYALICERLSLFDEAVLALQKATTLLEEDFEHSESSDTELKYTIALVNLGRVKLATKEYNGALESFISAWELLTSQDPAHVDDRMREMKVQCQVGQGLAYFWLGGEQLCLDAFQMALDEAEGLGGGVMEIVTVLLARTLWGLGDDDARETAKARLMDCLSHENPSIAVVTTLAAIALVSNDEDLIDASISELESLSLARREVVDPQDDASLVLSTHAAKLGSQEEAVAILEKSVRSHPSDQSRRLRLAEMLIASGRSHEAIGILSPEGEMDGPVTSNGARDDAMGRAELLRLLGTAKVEIGELGGISDLIKAAKLCPWDDKSWQALAWARLKSSPSSSA